MKNKIFTTLLAVFFIFLGGFSIAQAQSIWDELGISFYEIRDNQVYFDDELIEEADFHTFTQINSFYAKDNANVYVGPEVIEGADLSTFTVLGLPYSKDKNNVYLLNEIVEGVDVNSFTVFTDLYLPFDTEKIYIFAKDNNNVYFLNLPMTGINNVSSFNFYPIQYAEDLDDVFEQIFAYDINDVYVCILDQCSAIPEIDKATFEIISMDFVKDKNNIYYCGSAENCVVVDNLDEQTLEVLDDDFIKDKNNLYYCNSYGCSIVSGVDPQTVEFIEYDYLKDKDNVYYCGAIFYEDCSVVTGADPDTFELIDMHFARDKNYGFFCDLFEMCKIIPGSDGSSFMVLDYYYAIDNLNAYYYDYYGVQVIDCDTNTFAVDPIYDNFSKDKDKAFYLGKEIVGVDIGSFKAIGYDTAQDNYNIYINGEKVELENQQPETISDSQLDQILQDARTVYENAFSKLSFNDALNGQEYVDELRDGFSITGDDYDKMLNFIMTGTQSTYILGAGERAGVINSYKAAFNKLPKTETEWQDVIKIANGRWPSETSQAAEDKAKQEFKKIYLRDPDINNAHDDAAVTVIAYGLRPADRNLDSEKNAINIFKDIYNYNPISATDWDIVRAIAYSGAVR